MTPVTTGPVLMPMCSLSGAPVGSQRSSMASIIASAISAAGSAWSGRASGRPPRQDQDHVGVADGLDLLEVVARRDAIELREDVVEQLDQLVGSNAGGNAD